MSTTYDNINFSHNENSKMCYLGKQRKLKLPQSISRAENTFDFVHMDIWGPINKISIHKCKTREN